MKRRDTTFEDWINERGSRETAKLLGVTKACVNHWRSGHALPSDNQKRIIKQLTRGRVTYDSIIEGSCSPLNRGE